jgi:hypothetical protein
MMSISVGMAQPARIRACTGDYVWWAALTTLCIVLLAPLLIVDVPPLLDYPNHLARAFILASLPDDTVLARFYTTHWTIIPNLGLDLIAPSLIHLLPVDIAGRLVIATALLLPVLGAVAYNTALGGRWWSLGVGLVAYNSSLLSGFLNFSLSLGLALLLAAVWLRWREHRPWHALTLAIICAPVLFVCHLMGLIFFAQLIAGAEIAHLLRLRHRALWQAGLARGAILLLIFATPAALYAMSALQQLGGAIGFLPWGEKLLQLTTAFVNYSGPLDQITAVSVIAVIALCVALRWGRLPAPAAFAIILLLVTFLAAPFAWKGTFGLDTRFAIMMGFMLFAGFVPSRWPPAVRSTAIAMLTLLFIARMTLLTIAWTDRRTDLADLREVLAPIQPGQAIYFAETGPEEAPAYWDANPHWRKLSNGTRTDEHLGALALIERRAYWPFQFDMPSQQPVKTRKSYRTLADKVGSLPTWNAAAVADVCGFDYVLLLDADAMPALPDDRFRLFIRSGFAALYTITQCWPNPSLTSRVLTNELTR